MATTHFSGPIALGSGSVKTITAATTLTKEDNGSLCVLNAAAGATVTLPALSAGLRFKFVVGAAFATSNWVVASPEGDNIEGSLIVAAAAVTVDAADQINFVNTAENIGDYVNLWCDGTYWYADGIGLTAGSITATG